MKPRASFRLIRFVNPSGEVCYRVTGTKVDGTRVRQNYKTEIEALSYKQELEIQATNVKTDIATHLKATRLTDAQIMQAEHAFAELGDQPMPKAIRFFLENYRAPLQAITIRDAFAQFIADKHRQNCRPDSITSLQRKNALLLKDHGDKNVNALLPEQAKDIVFRKNLSPVSQDNVRRAMGCFFNWAVEQAYCQESPLAKIKAVKIERDEPQVLSLDDVRRLLKAAAAYKNGVVLPFVAISLFAAVRPKEVERLTWEDVNLGQKTITIQGKGAKMRERRIVELSANLVDWLSRFALARPPFVGKNWRRDFDAVKRKAGYGGRGKKAAQKQAPEMKPWTPDIMRHTAISMHLAQHQHEGRTASWAGNSPDIIQRHYRGLVNPSDATQFWAITPEPAKGKIVKLPAEAAA